MKVKTLLATLAYTVDEVEVYNRNWDLLFRSNNPSTLADSDCRDMAVHKFWIYTFPDGTTLEMIVIR